MPVADMHIPMQHHIRGTTRLHKYPLLVMIRPLRLSS